MEVRCPSLVPDSEVERGSMDSGYVRPSVLALRRSEPGMETIVSSGYVVSFDESRQPKVEQSHLNILGSKEAAACPLKLMQDVSYIQNFRFSGTHQLPYEVPPLL